MVKPATGGGSGRPERPGRSPPPGDSADRRTSASFRGRPRTSGSARTEDRQLETDNAALIGRSENYVRPHDPADGYVPQECVRADHVYDVAKDQGYEADIRWRLETLKAACLAGGRSAAARPHPAQPPP